MYRDCETEHSSFEFPQNHSKMRKGVPFFLPQELTHNFSTTHCKSKRDIMTGRTEMGITFIEYLLYARV
jgi:hypothetical protein